jgi:hypothetical protein
VKGSGEDDIRGDGGVLADVDTLDLYAEFENCAEIINRLNMRGLRLLLVGRRARKQEDDTRHITCISGQH